MRIKLDENLPVALKADLTTLGHDVHTVGDEGLIAVDNSWLWEVCQAESRFLITQDLDFSDIRRFAPGMHAGILLVRLNVPGPSALRHFVRELASTFDVNEWSFCLVVATKNKVRVLRGDEAS